MSKEMATYTIGTMATLTGLSTHTIRAWERRYSLLTPDRTGTNRRIYGDEDVKRLALLKQLTESGHSIGQIAHLTHGQLQTLGASLPSRTATGPETTPAEESHRLLSICFGALESLDAAELEGVLVRGAGYLGALRLVTEVILPLLDEMEQRWLRGELRISQEHMASAVLRAFLDRVRLTMPGPPGAPRLLLTTPRNQHHELGLLLASIFAATAFWNVTYLGTNLPATEIADAARMTSTQAVGLSLVYPLEDASLFDELRLLRNQLGPSMPIIVGGRGASSYSSILQEIGAVSCKDLDGFREVLDSLRGH